MEDKLQKELYKEMEDDSVESILHIMSELAMHRYSELRSRGFNSDMLCYWKSASSELKIAAYKIATGGKTKKRKKGKKC